MGDSFPVLEYYLCILSFFYSSLSLRYGAHQVTVEVDPNTTFRTIAEEFFLLRKKANKYSEHIEVDDCVPRMSSSEIFFDWSQPVSEMLRLSWVFREKEPDQESLEDLIEHIVIVTKKDIGDASRRLSLRADPDEQAVYTGYLWKKGSGAIAAFRRRWFILQGCTLYYQEDPSSSSALGYIPMGGCDVKLRSDLTHKTYGKTMFELTAESLGKRDFVLCAETTDEMNRFISAVEALNLRRVKSVAVNVFEELSRRSYARMQGIFRVSGDKNTVDAIKRAYDMTNYPVLSEFKDEHALGSVLKLTLRQMSKPLMPYSLYGDFVQMGRSNPSRRALLARDLVFQIPAPSRHFLQYLAKSLNDVAVHQDTNMMSAKNLAIVFAPNILRPQVETVQTSMSDNAAILACVNTLIEEQTFIFGPSPIRSNSIVPIFPPHLLEGAGAFKVGSKKKPTKKELDAIPPSPSAPASPTNVALAAPSASPNPVSISAVSPFSTEGMQTLDEVEGLTADVRRHLDQLLVLRNAQEDLLENYARLEKALRLGPFQADGLVEFISDKTAVDYSFLQPTLEQLQTASANLVAITEQLELNANSQTNSAWTSVSTSKSAPVTPTSSVRPVNNGSNMPPMLPVSEEPSYSTPRSVSPPLKVVSPPPLPNSSRPQSREDV